MLTEDQVVVAYRALLGREPENQEIVANWLRHAPGFESLCRGLLSSEEFLQKFLAERFAGIMSRLEPGPPISVEWQVEPGILEQMLERIKETWSRLGEPDPFWSVLSAERFRGENFAENAQIYWNSGRSDVEFLNRWLARNHAGPFGKAHSCIEYGCGTGRVTRWLAEQFSHVTALDVSAPHIGLARDHVLRAGLSNARFIVVESLAPPPAVEPVDVVFCRIVLQHNPPPVIALLVEQFFAWLKPGGVALLQVPTYSARYTFDARQYLAEPLPPGFEMHLLPQQHIFALAEKQHCRLLEVEPDDCLGWHDWISNTFLFQKTG